MLKHVENEKKNLTQTFLELLELSLPIIYNTTNPEELEAYRNYWLKKSGIE